MEMMKMEDNTKPMPGRGNDKAEKTIANNVKQRQHGGIRTMPFIFANEICDKFAATGFHANMITYLTQQLNLPLVKASNILTNFGGTSNFTPLLGALIADSFAGRFWTIIVASFIYELGMICITMSAVVPSLRPPPCPSQQNCQEASHLQLSVLYISLLLTSIGAGGIRPCLVPFAADQIDMSKSSVDARSWNFFNWYYFGMGFATLIALTVIVYIQDNVGWGWGLGIPSIAWAISIMTFVAGSSLYMKVKPGGSPLVRLAQVSVAAFKKRKLALPHDHSLLYRNRELDSSISVTGWLLHSDQFKWLDKAAVVTEEEQKSLKNPNLWRLNTVHRVEELKSIVRMLPIWASGVLAVTASSHIHSFVVMQARSMNRHLTRSFEIPPATLSIFSTLTVMIGLVVYERFFVPMARRFTKNPAGITCLQRMGIGFSINIFATITSALVETKRKKVAADHNLLDSPSATIPISVFWLVPQYFVHGIAEVFSSVGHMEFMYDQSPESMRSTAQALYVFTLSIGNYMGTALVTLVYKFTGPVNGWLPDRNLNRGKLDYYYYLVTVIQAVNLIYYFICAWFYVYKPLDESKNNHDGEEDVESASKDNKSSYTNGNHGELEMAAKSLT